MMGPTSPVRPKTKVLMQCPGNLAAVGRTDCTLERPRLGVKSPVKSPVRTPSYRASTWTVHNAARMWLVHLKYRHLAGQYRLCTSTGTVHSIPYGQSRLIRAVCRISPQNSSTCSIAPLRTRPAQNLVYIGAGRVWQTEHCLSVRLPPPPEANSRSARPRPSNRCQVLRPVLSTPVRGPCSPVGAGEQHDTDQHITIGQRQVRAGQGKADRSGIGETCGVSTMQQDLHIALHMQGSLDRRMLYVGVDHLVSSNFCPLLQAHARTRKVVRRSAQVVLGLIYPRYPSLPSPHPPLPPYNISLHRLLLRFWSEEILPTYACLYCTALVVLLGPYYHPSSLDRWSPQGGEPYCAPPAGHS